ncbi:location of vulva defective 1 [Trichomycterus rosablanca]|uniref:location of vulva defective 1 n=1 Tax=Trichomycterus rosablanca TaxID=2290929 RepID=UPI002F3534DB
MKTTAVSLTVWMAQVLMTCSLNSTTNTDPSTTTALQMTTVWKTVPTASLSTDQTQSITIPSGTEVPGFKTQNDFTNTTDNGSTINSIQHITSPEVVTVSLNSTSLATKNDNPETGTVTRVTLQEHTVTTGLSTTVQADHAVQTTSFLTWTEGRSEKSTSNTEASSTTASTVTWKDEINESTEYYEITPTTDHSIQVQTLNLESTQNTEEPLVSTTDVSMTPEAQTDQKTTEDHSTAQTTNTYNSINTTRSDDTTRTEAITGEGITVATNSTETQSTTTAEATTGEGITTATNSTETQGTTTAEATTGEDLTVTSINLNNVTNITETRSATRTEASYTWTTLLSTTNASENVSRTETKWTLWPNCYDNDKDVSVTSGRSSKLVCFVTLWSLGMTASIFLGLTIFLWVRLSVIKKRARLKGRRDKGEQKAAKERESLWAEHYTSAEDRVEFWYANGTTIEANKKGSKRQKKRPAKTKDERKEEKEEDLWIQPKVTLQDITDFWRVRNVDVDAS